jgi:hypothetical protein
MRQMFTSARLENVERVDALFQQAGIATKVIGGRSYKGHSRRGFSYNDGNAAGMESPPQLWVLHADDYRRAREILLAEGLLEVSAEGTAVPSFRPSTPKAEDKKSNRLVKTRMALMVIVIGLIAIQGLRLLVQNG